ncbi:hypothetical protein INR49_028043 [Caranx melampygus]|nr:hypothetical protein INR49_028043 [Caranx melampygus]
MRVPPLRQAAVFAALLALGMCLTGSHVCPRSLDCARERRHFCQPGSSHCGPCLRPFVENSHGRCVVKRRHSSHSAQIIKGKMSTHPELDEEIDFLAAIISEQRTEARLPAPLSQDVPQPVTKQLSELGHTHRPSTAEHATGHTVPFTRVTPPTTITNHTPALLSGPIILPYPTNDRVFITMSTIFIAAGSLALIIAGACWVRLQKGVRLTRKVDFAAYGLIGAQNFDTSPGDKKLAHSAQMYHYQHQKQQMLSLEKRGKWK